VTLLRHSDLKTAFATWDELQGETPDSELRGRTGDALSGKSEARDFRTVKMIFEANGIFKAKP
jgi:hypothetical protein